MSPRSFIEKLLDRLPFREEDLQHATLEQPGLMLKAVEYRTQCMRERQRVESRLEEYSRRKALKIRSSHRGEKRLTEKHIVQRVGESTTVTLLKRELAEAELLEEYSKMILEVFRQRLQALKILVEFSFFSSSAGSGVTDRLRKKRDRLKHQGRYGGSYDPGPSDE